MKRVAFLLAAAFLFITGCSIHEADQPSSLELTGDEFYATFESYSDPDTKVYVDEDVKILWNADDRVSIFNKISYNQEYRFTGKEGANAGGFKKVDADEFVTGAQLSYVAAVYPYLEDTEINNKNVMTVTMPTEQHYKAGSFGPGANTMVATAEDNVLLFKNLGGYLVLKFYGENVNVASVKLEGNAGEVLSGAGSFKPAVGTIPSVSMSATGGKSITLVCDEPVTLGTTKEEATPFWLVVPPTEFKTGFTLTVTDTDGNTFVKKTDKDLTINRNGVLRISAIEIEMPEPIQPNNIIYYTSTDGNVVKPYALSVFGGNLVSNDYVNGRGVMTFDANVTSIGNNAFYNCSSLKSLAIPATATNIGNDAFCFCNSLQEITISESITTIGDEAFLGCTSLATVTIPNSVTSIGNSAFGGCESLTSFSGKFSADNGRCLIIDNIIIAVATNGLSSYSIPNGVIAIEGAFNSCTLSSITIPNTVHSIGRRAFMKCNNLKSITISESVTVIGLQAFDTSGLVSITIPSNVTIIDGWAFGYCRSLESVTIEDGVQSIGANAFYSCSALNSIILPQSITTIYASAFESCSGLKSITVEAPVPPTLAYGNTDAFLNTSCPIFVPANSLDTYKTEWSTYADRIQPIEEEADPNYIVFGDEVVKKICVENWDTNKDGELSYEEAAAVSSLGNAFRNKQITTFNELEYFTSIDKIDTWAFSDCTELMSIKLPAGIKEIEWYAFMHTRIESISIPNSVTTIEEGAFAYCSQLNHFEGNFASEDGKLLIKDNVLIGFADPNAVSVVIPSSEIDVESIGDWTFAGHANLKKVTCMCEVERNAFVDCPSLEELTISGGLIDSSFLDECHALTHLIISGEDSDYGYNGVHINLPFWSPANLESITLPKNAQISGPVYLPIGCQIYGPNASADHTSWIVQPDWWSETVELQLFSFPFDVSSYRLPSTVTKISAGFNRYDKRSGHALDVEIHVPSSVKSIKSLDHVTVPLYMEGSDPPTIENGRSFEEPSVIYVKSSDYSAYQSAWSSYISNSQIDLREY